MSVESQGARLKKLRLEKGLTLEEVHKRTKIHLNILKSIEEDNFVNLNPIYIKGFIKIYCRFLGADPRSFIPDFREIRTVAELKPKKEEKQIKLKPFKLNINFKPILAIAGVIVLALILINLGKAAFSKIKQVKVRKEKAVVLLVEKPAKKAESPKAQKSSPLPVPALIRLGIHAKENCYITLKADGKVLFQGVLKKSRSESWQAKDKFELSLGDAGAVELEINGKVISGLGKKGRAIKNIVITKEGLSIGR